MEQPPIPLKKGEYVISDATTFDEEWDSYSTKVGIQGKHLLLHYSVWGKTPEESKSKAIWLVKLLVRE